MRLLVILSRYARCPRKLIRALGTRGLLNWIPDKMYLKLIFWGETGKRLNLKSPNTFNEKLQWLKIYDRNPEYSMYVDKYEVRSYIREKIGEQYLIPIIGVYDSVDDIKWGDLPNRFVLKCTHGSASNIICKNKNDLDIKKSKDLLSKWMKRNWYWFGREWPYKNIKPRIVCETFISENYDTPNDYKVLCFNGKVRLIQIHTDRYGNHKHDFYDVLWNKTEISQGYNNSDIELEKPRNLEEMIQLSEQLAKDLPHVRIDWYIVNEKLFFGEITFYNGSGLVPFGNEEDDYRLGSWINLKGH